jgi:iron complex transport system substrate-binding protein
MKSIFALIVVLAVTAAASPEAATVTYTDKMGRTVTIETPVKRAVLFETYELLPAIGGIDQIAGLGRYAFENDLMLATNPGIAQKIPSVGTAWEINIEALLKVRPDIVLTFMNSNPDAVKFMESKGLKVLSIYPETLPELYDVMRLEGKLFAQEQKVERVISEMEGIFSLIRDRVSHIPAVQRKKALMLMIKQTMVAGHKGIYQDLFDLIGVSNCADSRQNFPEVSIERIISWNPDLLYFVWYARYSAADLLNNPQWRHIRAIKDGNVYKELQGSTWSPRLAPSALWMAAKAYPERFRDVNVERVIDRFYRQVYGIPYSMVKQNAD